MIRVMIVEDEPPSMRRIARMIQQSGLGFEVAATAGDGEQALEQMEKTPCDVVFTDIRMPVMDGLQLMDALRDKYPDCQIVVISGYQEYAYFSRALRAKASDYLLKPLSSQEMDALLLRLREAHEERRRETLSRRLAAEINRSELVKRPKDAAEPARKLVICLFCAGAMPYSEDAEMYPGDAAWLQASPEEVFLEMLPDYGGFVWLFMGNTPVERIFIFGETENAEATVRELHERMADRTGVPITCAYTAKSVEIPRAGAAIKSLRALIAGYGRIGVGIRAALREDIPPIAPPPGDAEVARRLARALETTGLPANAPFCRELAARIEREAWTQRRVHRLFMDALAVVESRGAVAPGPVEQARQHLREVIGTALSLKDLFAGLENLGVLAAEGFDKPSPAQRGVAREVERYLRQHFAQHISVQMLGAVFGYVPSYVSLLFRKAYGVSPAEYLTRVRMGEAKRLMQQNPGMLIREVAERVGFKSQHHFSRVFKKSEGVWPTQFQ